MGEPPTWVTLTEDERIILHQRPSIYPYLMGQLGSVLLVVVGAVLALAGVGVGSPPIDLSSLQTVLLVIGVLLLAIGLLGIAWSLLRWWSLEYVATTKEVYRKQGIVSRSVTNLSIDRIQNTTFDQSVIGRILSYGHVRIATAGTGGTEVVFRYVSNPADVVAMITEQRTEYST